MTDWAIRTATEADVEDVLALWRGAGGRPSATDDAEAVAALLAKDPEALLVAEGEAPAVALWGAAGYERQASTGRFVRMV
jgi:hypothetical protein